MLKYPQLNGIIHERLKTDVGVEEEVRRLIRREEVMAHVQPRGLVDPRGLFPC